MSGSYTSYLCGVEYHTESMDMRNRRELEPLQVNDDSRSGRAKQWCHTHCCTYKVLQRRLPIITWLPKYSFADFKGDLIAGTTVALTVIPQGLALALLAGLPPQYGLYTAFMGCFVYTIFGSCKNLTIGPTSVMSLMTAQHVAMGGVTYCILMTFIAGCIMLAMGILNLGFLVTFISSSVVSGFTTAAAITIATSQLSGIFGLKFKSQSFIEDLINCFIGMKNGEVKYWDMTMGVMCIVFLLLISYFRDVEFNCCSSAKLSRALSSLWRIISTARNALLVIICAAVAGVLLSHSISVLTLTQEVEAGLPHFKFPVFHYSYFDNATNQTIDKDFVAIIKDMGSGVIVIPLLCVLEAVAIAKSFAKGKKIDATQEMIALGLCNIFGSFVSSYPATGSFSRTAINYNSGVRTTAGGIATGSIVLLALGVMSPYFHYIPKASLSALIFVSVLNMVHYKDICTMWKTNKFDLLPFVATIVFSFTIGLEYGILIGVGISLCFLMYQEARPKIFTEEKKTFLGTLYLYVKPDRSVYFPSAEFFQLKIINSVPDEYPDRIYAIVLDGEHIMSADYSMALCCRNLINAFKKDTTCIIFVNFQNYVTRTIRGAFDNVDDFIYFASINDAEAYIDGLYIDKLPPAYDIESVSEEVVDVGDTNDSGLFEK